MAFGGGHAYYHPPRYHEYQLDDVKIIASFDERAGTVFGDVTNTVTTIRPSTSYIDFDSADLHYTSVGEPDGRTLHYQTFGETLRVFLPKPADVGTKIAIHCGFDLRPRDELRIDSLLHQPVVEEACLAIGFAVHRNQPRDAL